MGQRLSAIELRSELDELEDRGLAFVPGLTGLSWMSSPPPTVSGPVTKRRIRFVKVLSTNPDAAGADDTQPAATQIRGTYVRAVCDDIPVVIKVIRKDSPM